VVTDREIDELLAAAGRSLQGIDPALRERIAASIQPSLRPVRPLRQTWVLASGLFLTCTAVAVAGAARAGFYGFEKMESAERALIFSALIVLVGAAAVEFVCEMIPGSRVRVTPVALLGATSVALLAVFAALFRDYETTHFFSAGIVCLATGVLHAAPAALIGWWLLRRGFAVNAVAAGLAAGLLGGLAGVTMLELHCPNFQAAHILVWHTAVVPLSGAIGATIAWALRFRTRPAS
jgi:hypothetical protein